MLSPIVEFFEKLITEFSWRRLFFVLTIFFISLVSLISYESYTGHFRLNRIERSAKLLNDLQRLSQEAAKNQDDELSKIYKGISNDLNAYVNHKGITPFSLPVWLLKALAAVAPWILISAIFLASAGGSSKSAAFGTMAASIPCAGIGIMLPDFSNPLWNYVGAPIAMFLVFFSAVTLIMSNKRKS